jgi:hypothetical protein
LEAKITKCSMYNSYRLYIAIMSRILNSKVVLVLVLVDG